MSRIRIGNAPCSWGTLEFAGLEGDRLTYGRMLDELAATGYTGTELGDWGFMPTDPAALRAELTGRGLTMTGAFVPVAFADRAAHAEGAETALRIARLLQAVAAPDHKPFIVLADNNGADPVRTRHAGRVTAEMGLSREGWEVFAAGVERVAAAVRDATGLPAVFHHHCAGYVETPTEIERLLSLTDPALVGLVFDTGHYVYGSGRDDGAVVLDGLARFGDRVWYMHFKDCQPDVARLARAEGWDYFEAVRRGVFCELGQGGVPFPAVVDWLLKRGYDGWVTVEQDVLPGMGAPQASAARNRAYLDTLRINRDAD